MAHVALERNNAERPENVGEEDGNSGDESVDDARGFKHHVLITCKSKVQPVAALGEFFSSSFQPTDVNIKNIQGPKPSAHIVASYLQDVSYPINTVIKDWSTSDPHSHLEGGMTYDDGKLMVPMAGRYYIYAQFHFKSVGRVQVRVNDDFVSLISSPVIQEGFAINSNTMGVFALNANDTISLRINPWGAPADGSVKFWMQYHGCFFGAFLI
ncbi:hypothetical protein ACROYT_G022606 [Oculina patagonica]